MYWTEELFSKRIVPLLLIHLKPTWQTGPEHNLFYLHLLKKKGHWRNKKWTQKHFYWIEYLFPQSRAYSNQYTLLPSNSIIYLEQPLILDSNPLWRTPDWFGWVTQNPKIVFSEPSLLYFLFLFSLCVCMAEKHDVVTFITFPFVPRRKSNVSVLCFAWFARVIVVLNWIILGLFHSCIDFFLFKYFRIYSKVVAWIRYQPE